MDNISDQNNQNQENDPNHTNATRSQPTQPSKKNITTAGGPIPSKLSSSNPCRAFDVAELYRQRKQFQLQKIQEEEERLRRHQARPMPNFKKIHSKALAVVKASTEHAVVSPETPEVLRRGLAMKAKQQQKVKDFESKLSERPPIVSRSTKVLTEVPFKPKLEKHQPVKVEPFNLKMIERLAQRKEFDENYQRELAKKKEKEKQLKEIEDEKTRQAVRERTRFKANPNPFKKAAS